MTHSIRPAVPDDAPDLVRLINGLAAYEKMSADSVPDEHVLRAQLRPDAAPRIEAFVAEFNGRVVGFALYYPTYSTFLTNFGLYLEDLFVEPEWRGKGIGMGLFDHVVDLARQRNCRRLEWSVLDWNESAINFYCRRGAVSLSDWSTMRLSIPR